MSKFKRRPGVDTAKLEAFLFQAPVQTQKETPKDEEEAEFERADNERLTRSINFRLTDKELKQLRFIAKYAGMSMNTFIRLAVQSHLDRGVEIAKKRKEEQLF